MRLGSTCWTRGCTSASSRTRRSSPTLRPEHFTGLEAIAEFKGLRRRVLVYRGRERLKTADGVEVLPFDVFAKNCSQGCCE